ncbi:hypothetical protein BBK82_15860 [Lentzea guizhouensis]|uniref:Uncharacterized protein n=1 Tax=Lentzea guizhouensis TaxID=1586287 RepID=A0A1B2HHY6_9PSEU|nr:hypothetical protein [Lentzea guizhouensis]ANZ37316.1 hypothetical protein BBK82_15860 [Lentzea guizhouensis]
MLTRKALLIPAAASAGLLIVLAVAGWGGDSGPLTLPASSGPNTSTTQQVSIVPTPEIAEITVKTSTSTTTTTTTTTTTRKPPPPPVQPPPPPPVTTTEPPQRGLFVNEGARCDPEGATGIGLRGEALVCRKDDRRADRLRWQKA